MFQETRQKKNNYNGSMDHFRMYKAFCEFVEDYILDLLPYGALQFPKNN
jgi:hypothetical protein